MFKVADRPLGRRRVCFFIGHGEKTIIVWLTKCRVHGAVYTLTLDKEPSLEQAQQYQGWLVDIEWNEIPKREGAQAKRDGCGILVAIFINVTKYRRSNCKIFFHSPQSSITSWTTEICHSIQIISCIRQFSAPPTCILPTSAPFMIYSSRVPTKWDPGESRLVVWKVQAERMELHHKSLKGMNITRNLELGLRFCA
ncbi:hypothetical protein P691DRAFT_362458 [Macrolepiota fuliginosa MF-IS2]|uniref:Uncharacterized protein n=1 Tax=Macrolepiota fuliginosa MF-IS2 TaxID=1400762 RepID=A0A9P5X6K0_9AGAR|nr:hypothetical protein P691DRAFT_362458 [Macrolepiota fuliginosa MF-IS2]